jgi:hypothetical protein
MAKQQELTAGQRAYEAKRARKAGVSLEKWLAEKDKRVKAEAVAEAKEAAAAAKAAQPEKKGWFGRLLDKAHQPLK